MPKMASTASRPPAPTIFIGNIPYDLTEDALIEIFQEVGPVKSFRLVNDRDTGMAKGYGFCEYYDTTTAESAVRNLNNHEINGRSIRVDFADEHVSKPSTPKVTAERERTKEDLPAKEMPVGMDAVRRAACKMAFLLGGRDVTLSKNPPTSGSNLQIINEFDEIYAMLAEMRRKEMFELLAGMKDVVQRNFAHAKSLLIQNPQLSRTLFLMEIVLGIVDAPDFSDENREQQNFEDLEMTDVNAQPSFTQLVVNPPPPPMQALAGFDMGTHQQPMTNYQPVVPAPNMFTTSNLPGLNAQSLTPTIGVMTGSQQNAATWTGGAASAFPAGLAFGGQEPTPMVAQPFAGVPPGMQVVAQPGQILPGVLGSQNHVLLGQQLAAQPQPMVPIGNVAHGEAETEVQPMVASVASEPEMTLVQGDVLDEQTKSQLNQILSLTDEQLAALPPEHRDQAVAIRRQLGKMT